MKYSLICIFLCIGFAHIALAKSNITVPDNYTSGILEKTSLSGMSTTMTKDFLENYRFGILE